ncbi:MAG: hypothetical protein EKK36_01970 [Bradyrhizobiaceae bacterium]|nr:MAG: hypothetical protein EKK36_01970 [Bradyrhizobiaceae bacterium]
MSKAFLTLLVLLSFLLAGCAVERAIVAQTAQDKIVGMSRENVLACMGPPASRAAEGTTEVWSYNSGNGHTIAIGQGYSETDSSVTGLRTGNQITASGNATTSSFSTATSVRRSCTVNVVMTEGRVSRVNYIGPTGGILTRGEQCAFAVQSCTQ